MDDALITTSLLPPLATAPPRPDVADLRAALAALTPRQLARVLAAAGVAPASDDADALLEAGVLGVDALAGVVRRGDDEDETGAAHRSVGSSSWGGVTPCAAALVKHRPPSVGGGLVSLTAHATGRALGVRVPTPADADGVTASSDGGGGGAALAAAARRPPPPPCGRAATPPSPAHAFATDAAVALNSDDPSVAAMAAWAVTRWITLRPCEWTHLTAARAVEPLVDLLLSADSQACACGALALRAFAVGGGRGAQAEAARAGAVGAAVSALAGVADDAAWTDAAAGGARGDRARAAALAARAAQQEAVAALVGALTRRNDALKLAAVCAGAVPRLAALLHASSPQLAAAAAASLQPLTSLPAARDALRACPGAVAALARLLRADQVECAPKAAAAALQNVALDPAAARDLLAAAALPALARALASGTLDGGARAAACAAVANMLRLDEGLVAADAAAADVPRDRRAVPPLLASLVSSGGLDILLALLAGRGPSSTPAAARDAAVPLLVAASTRAGRAALIAADGASAVVEAVARGGRAVAAPALDVMHALARDSAKAATALVGAGGLAAALDAVRRDADARNRALAVLHALAVHDAHSAAALGAADALHTLGVLVAAAADDVDDRRAGGGPAADIPTPILRLLTRSARLLVLLAGHPDNAHPLAALAPELRRLARRLVASPVDAVAAAGLDLHGVVA